MHSNARLDRPTLSAVLSFLLAVCLPYLVLTFAAPEARDVFLCFAFILWVLGLWPIDRMAGRLLPTLRSEKPQETPR